MNNSMSRLSSTPLRAHGSYPAIQCAATAAVLRWAVRIDADDAHALDWFRTVQIHEQGNKTAAELVRDGAHDEVIRFLEEIIAGCRG